MKYIPRIYINTLQISTPIKLCISGVLFILVVVLKQHILCIAYNCYMIDNILNSISIAEYRATYVYFD